MQIVRFHRPCFDNSAACSSAATRLQRPRSRLLASRDQGHCLRCVRVYHDLEERGHGSPRGLLQPCRRLRVSSPASFPMGLVELGNLQPAEQRLCADADRFGRFLDVPLAQQGGDGFFFLPPELRAVTYHLKFSATTCRICLLCLRTGVINVVTAVITAPGD
jgi:hypothetical protein